MKRGAFNTVLALSLLANSCTQPTTAGIVSGKKLIQGSIKPEVTEALPSWHAKPGGHQYEIFSDPIPTIRIDGNITINDIKYQYLINNNDPFLTTLFQEGKDLGCSLNSYIRIYQGPDKQVFTQAGNGFILESGDPIFTIQCEDQPRELVIAKQHNDGRNNYYLLVFGILEKTITEELEEYLANG